MARNVTRRRRRAIAGAALLGALLTVVLSSCLERFAFVPIRGAPSPTPGELGWPVWQEVRFPARDGPRLHGWLITGRRPPGRAAEFVVVHAHGNGGNLGFQFIPAVGMCLEHGCDVLMFDYRSFGLSEPGRLTRLSVAEDLAGAVSHARRTHPHARLLLLGQSMGGATAALAVREKEIRDSLAGLCLVSAFADWNVEFCDALKSSPLTWPLAYPIAYLLLSPRRPEPGEGLALWPADKPLLLVHGDADRVVPIHHLDLFLRSLPNEARGRARVLRIEGATHNSLGGSPSEGEDALRAALGEWIASARAAGR